MTKLPENTEFEGAVGVLMTLELGNKKYAILQKRTEKKPDGSPESFPGCLQVTVHGKLEKGKDGKRETFVDGLRREISEEKYQKRNIRREISEEIIEMLGRMKTSLSLEERMALGVFVSANTTTNQDAMDFYKSLIPNVFGQQAGVLVSSRKFEPEKKKKKTDVTTQFHIGESVLRSNTGLTGVIDKLRSAGVITLICSDDLANLVPLNPKLHKQNGVQEKGKYGMFQDEIDAVKKALK